MDNPHSDVYEYILNTISRNKPNINIYRNKREIYTDKYQTEQQEHRDTLISELLYEYVDAFKRKKMETSRDRKTLKIFAFLCSGLIIGAIIFLSVYVVLKKDVSSWQYLVAIIASLITLGSSLFAIIDSITERAFPADDEQYITEIVKLIQENDLKHKKENINAEKNYQSDTITEHQNDDQQ